MEKFLVRMTVIFVAIYFIASYIMAQFFGVDIMKNTYTLLFELCVVRYTFGEGKYHCKYIKWMALSIFCADTLSHFDYYYDFIPVSLYNYIFCGFVILGIFADVIYAFRHFHKVRMLKRQNH